jgi:hypothetical protein
MKSLPDNAGLEASSNQQKRSPPPAALLNKHFTAERQPNKPNQVSDLEVSSFVEFEDDELVDDSAGCRDLARATSGLFAIDYIGAPLPKTELIVSLKKEFDFWKFESPKAAADFIEAVCLSTGLRTLGIR